MKSIIFIIPFLYTAFLTAHSNAETRIPPVASWATIAIGPARNFRLPTPPPLGSRQLKRERNALLATVRTLSGHADANNWKGQSIIRWNAFARELVSKNKISPPLASRLYALLSVAQYDSLVTAWENKQTYRRQGIRHRSRYIDERYSYPSQEATIASVSAAILNKLFPSESIDIETFRSAHIDSIRARGCHYGSDISAAERLGQRVADVILKRASKDGSDTTFSGSIPTGPGIWFSMENKLPLLPTWGNVQPWLMTSGDQFRAPPPPAYDSAEFTAAVQEVRDISDSRTAEQLRIAKFWADGAGTSTPPGHWNEIASTYFNQERFTEIQTARSLALMNMAIMDAGISCWNTKFAYWLIRPSEVDSAITLPVGLPNFPSYSSGHATFSGAAAAVLGYILPNHADDFTLMANEAALSRIYGGIHYRFDSETGLTAGRLIGDLAIKKDRADGSIALRNRGSLR